MQSRLKNANIKENLNKISLIVQYYDTNCFAGRVIEGNGPTETLRG